MPFIYYITGLETPRSPESTSYKLSYLSYCSTGSKIKLLFSTRNIHTVQRLKRNKFLQIITDSCRPYAELDLTNYLPEWCARGLIDEGGNKQHRT